MMETKISDLRVKILKYRFDLFDEKLLQEQLFDLVLSKEGFVREYRLDSRNIVDFYHPELKIALEVKIQGSAMSIYRQIKRYCEFPAVNHICLVSAKAMSLPSEIEAKSTSVILLGKSWL